METHIGGIGGVQRAGRHGDNVREGQPGGARCPAEVLVSFDIHVWLLSVSRRLLSNLLHVVVGHLGGSFGGERTGIFDQCRVHVKGGRAVARHSSESWLHLDVVPGLCDTDRASVVIDVGVVGVCQVKRCAIASRSSDTPPPPRHDTPALD